MNKFNIKIVAALLTAILVAGVCIFNACKIMKLKKTFTLLIFCYLFNILQAHNATQTNYPFNQLKFSVTPALCSKLKVTQNNDAIFNSNPSFGAEASISYYQQIVKGFGVSLGIGINSTPYSFNFSFVPNVLNPDNSYFQKEIKVKRYEPLGMITVPIALSMLIPLQTSSWSIDIHVGAKFNYLFNSGNGKTYYEWDMLYSGISITDIKEKSFYWVENKIDKRFLFSYFLKVGATYTTKRKDGIYFNLITNYSPQIPITGNYMIHAKDGDNYGNFSKNINYLGFEVGYALTLCKKR